MAFNDTFMRLPQAIRIVVVGIVLTVIGVPLIALAIFLKSVSPGKPASASSPQAKSTGAAVAAAPTTPARTQPTSAKRR